MSRKDAITTACNARKTMNRLQKSKVFLLFFVGVSFCLLTTYTYSAPEVFPVNKGIRSDVQKLICTNDMSEDDRRCIVKCIDLGRVVLIINTENLNCLLFQRNCCIFAKNKESLRSEMQSVDMFFINNDLFEMVKSLVSRTLIVDGFEQKEEHGLFRRAMICTGNGLKTGAHCIQNCTMWGLNWIGRHPLLVAIILCAYVVKDLGYYYGDIWSKLRSMQIRLSEAVRLKIGLAQIEASEALGFQKQSLDNDLEVLKALQKQSLDNNLEFSKAFLADEFERLKLGRPFVAKLGDAVAGATKESIPMVAGGAVTGFWGSLAGITATVIKWFSGKK
jgi:hypothetical protein